MGAAKLGTVASAWRVLAIGLSVPLGACMKVPGPPPPPYHATGTHPSWNLLIDEHDIFFVDSGEQPIKEPTPVPIHGFAGEIYQAGRIDVNLVHAKCRDGTSDRIYPDTVQVTIDGRRFNGCGGL